MVFCRERGWKDDEEAVEAREGVCNMTDMLTRPDAASKKARLQPQTLLRQRIVEFDRV